MKILKSIDLFPMTFQLNIRNNQQLKTITGGISSIILISITLVLIILNIYNFFSNRIPSVLSTNEFYANNPSEKFDLNNINFASLFYIHEVNQLELAQYTSVCNYLKIDYKNLSIQIDKVGSLISCDMGKNEFSKNFTSLVSSKLKLNPKFTICFEKNDSSNEVELGGNQIFTSQSRALIFMSYFNICSNKNYENYCIDNNVLDKARLIFFMYHKNYYIDMQSQKGYSEFLDYDTSNLLASRDLLVEIKLKKNIIYSDENYIYDFFPLITHEFFSVSSIKFSELSRRNDVNIMEIDYIFQMDKYQQIYRRSYAKLDQLLSNTLSMFSIILIILRNVVKIIELGSVENYLMKKIYFFEPEREQSQIIKIKRNKVFDSKEYLKANVKYNQEDKGNKNNEKEDNDLVESSNDRNKLKSNNKLSEQVILNKMKDYLREEKPSNMRISRIYYLFCNYNNYSKKKELNRIINGEEMLYFDLNIINILKKLIEIELIKDIIFDRKQVNLLRMISNRKINSVLNIKDRINKIENKQFKLKSTSADLLRIYNHISMCSDSENIIDNRICSLIDINNILNPK